MNKAKDSHSKGGVGVRPGDRGVYMTSEKDLEKRAAREVLELFSKYVDDEPTAAPPRGVEPVDISKAVKAEVANLKKATSSLFHTKYIRGVYGTSFLLFDSKAPSPTDLVLKVMKDVHQNGENMFKACVKVHPFTHCCLATREDMEELASEILSEHFPEDAASPNYQFAVHAEKHCVPDHGIHTMDVIKIFADRVNKRHSVDLKHPEKVILVSIIKNLCCVAVVDGSEYEMYGKFNVRQCLEKYVTGEETTKRKAEDSGRSRGIKKVNSDNEMLHGVEAI